MSVPHVDQRSSSAAFLQGWTPQRLVNHWIDEVSALGVTPANALQTIALPASEHDSVRSSRLEWWPMAQLEALQRTTQLQSGSLPWAELSLDTRSGERQTLEYLLEAAGDAERVAAVLLSASLFARVERARARYPREAWPEFTVAQTLLKWTRARHMCHWDADCSATLPAHESEAGLVLGSMPQLVRFLAVEHARVLHRFLPVQIVLGAAQVTPVRHSFVPLAQARTFEVSRPPPAHSLRVPIDPERRRFAALDKPELEALIWSMPQRELAKQFGVSEASIAKRCKLLGIVKPQRGHWAKPRAPSQQLANDNSGRAGSRVQRIF